MPIKKSDGKHYTWREFFHQWKEGMENNTPLQQAQSNQLGYYTVFFGIVYGMYMSILSRTWWLLIVLSGSFILTGNAFQANWQKKRLLTKIEEEVKNG